MVVKTITITEDAYKAIKSLKRGEESFSDLFLRVGKKQLTVKDIMGILKHTPEESAEFRRRVREVHKGIDESMKKRIEDVRSRLKRFN
ncbi:MAG TPA: antitoxin VapB family protein [Candidatus Nanoarchaeia archaeon]|nr:antitoxin VapB family protein [Candidatus Nanoarchaeia archaeon]